MKHVQFDDGLEQITLFDDRFYTKDGKNYFPSVTTILDVYPKGFGFNQWLKDVGNNAQQIMERAGEFGTHVHDATEKLNHGLELELFNAEGKEHYTLEEWEAILKYKQFWDLVKPKLIANELSMCSPKLGYGGTIDRIIEINGKLWLIDIKTSNAMRKTYEMQLASYVKLWEEENPKQPIYGVAVIWLKASTRTEKIDFDKNVFQGKGWQFVTFDRHHNDTFKLFEHTHAIWKEENPVFVPANKVLPMKIKL